MNVHDKKLGKTRTAAKRGFISTAGLYGDLQGIAGRSFTQIDSFDLPMIKNE